MNSDRNYETRFTVNKDPLTVFNSIIDTRKWWSGDIEGGTKQLGDVFTYRYKNLHYSRQEIAELVPGRSVKWNVLEVSLNFVEDKTEWAGTMIIFDIIEHGGTTELVFTHIGLKPTAECYDMCSDAWSALIQGSLKELIETGSTNLLELDAAS
ncbi:SRPBCC domain-containing protein [Chelativorans sp. AA-79]|nr:SRPBCC domain-containing protein [Chelativorans sp. AA-79]WEX07971.1 SRPBCC domain-containing protein [Chelativorans sp. AA-79]